MANGDSFVPVTGPDGKAYQFPKGTTKDVAISYFKKKGIGVAPAATPPAGPKPDAGQPSPEHQSYFTELSKASTQAQQMLGKARPRWDQADQVLQDPTWYGRSSRYLGGEAIGAGKAVAGGALSGVKILSDVMASMDPRELYQPTGKAQELGGELYGAGKGILYDLPKAAYDLVRHFPESTSDPEKLGSTVANIAMTVDGGLKSAHAIAEHLFPDEMSGIKTGVAKTAEQTNKMQAALMAQRITQNKALHNQIKWRAIADTYIHSNGVDLAKDYAKAYSEAEKEDKIHTDNLASIDTAIPSGVIDASKEAKSIKDNFAEVVKTPDPLNKALSEAVKDANATAPGQWTYVKTMQFRTKIGRAMQGVEGPQYRVMKDAYDSLTKSLGDTATKYGLEDSWNQHNELARKMHKSFPLIEKAKGIISDNGNGSEMAEALKNEPAANEVTKSLSKYGLDEKKVAKYRKNSQEVLRTRPTQNQRLTSYIYKVGPGTIPAMVGLGLGKGLASAAGMGSEGWIAGLGLGATAGAASVMLSEYLRARRLSPQILDGIISSREWPGKLVPPEGKFPTQGGETTEVAGPEPSSGAPQLPAAPTAPEGPTAQAATMPQAETAEIPGGKSISNKAKAAQVKAERTEAQKTQSHLAEVDRLNEVIKDKEATPEEVAIAKDQLKHHTEALAQPKPKKTSKYVYRARPVGQTGVPSESHAQATNDLSKVTRYKSDLEEQTGKPHEIVKIDMSNLREGEHYTNAPAPEGQTWTKFHQPLDESVVTKAAEPKVTKIAEGEHGTGKIARTAKQRERVAAVRKVKGSTALGGGTQEISGGGVSEDIAKAQERVNSPNIDVSKVNAVDLERALQGLDPKKFKEAIDMRKKHQMTSEEYEEVLRFFYTEAMEDKINRPAAD